MADSLLHSLVSPFLIEGHEITIGASIGISIFPDQAATTTICCNRRIAQCTQPSAAGKTGSFISAMICAFQFESD